MIGKSKDGRIKTEEQSQPITTNNQPEAIHSWASSDVVICLAILAKAPKCLFSQMHIALAKLFNMHQENNKLAQMGNFCLAKSDAMLPNGPNGH